MKVMCTYRLVLADILQSLDTNNFLSQLRPTTRWALRLNLCKVHTLQKLRQRLRSLRLLVICIHLIFAVRVILIFIRLLVQLRVSPVRRGVQLQILPPQSPNVLLSTDNIL
jgi:hypothetical protein